MTRRTAEIFRHHVVGEGLLALRWDEVPEPLAMQVGAGDALGEVAVVAEEMLAERVGDDLVHVYTDDAAGFLCFGPVVLQWSHDRGSAVWACADARRSPAAQVRGVSRRGSQKRMRPQVSQVKIWSSCSRPVRSFQRCGRTIIWQAEHLWSMASERPLPLAFAMRS